jgi:hypothetical protein
MNNIQRRLAYFSVPTRLFFSSAALRAVIAFGAVALQCRHLLVRGELHIQALGELNHKTFFRNHQD